MNMHSISLATVAFEVQVAGLLLGHWLEGSGGQERRLGIHPLSHAVEHLKPPAVLVAALRALHAASQVSCFENSFGCLCLAPHLQCEGRTLAAIKKLLATSFSNALRPALLQPYSSMINGIRFPQALAWIARYGNGIPTFPILPIELTLPTSNS